MKRVSFFTLLLTICNLLNGQDFNMDELSRYTFTGQKLANIWGYAGGGKEFALVGTQTGMTILEVTTTGTLTPIIHIAGANSTWREIKTYDHYAYVATEGGGGITIVDLADLPNLPPCPNLSSCSNTLPTFTLSTGGTGRVHALHVDESAAKLYLYGGDAYSGAGRVYKFTSPGTPTAPVFVAAHSSGGYVHDGYVDANVGFFAHINAGTMEMIQLNSNNTFTTFDIVTTPTAFTHNTWPAGANHVLTTDETTASFLGSFDYSNSSDIKLVDKVQITVGTQAIVHNTHTTDDDYAVTSWYRDGVAIVDASRPDNLVVTGRFDTYTATGCTGCSGSGFNGCWGVYPYLPSGKILASNITAPGSSVNGEVVVLDPTYERACWVEGVVTDAATGNPIAAASVQIGGLAAESTTALGVFKTGRYATGTATVTVSKSGYNTFSGTVAFNRGVVTTLNVALTSLSFPLELVSFDAEAVGEHEAMLRWEIANPINVAGFEVQQSRDGIGWTTVGTLPFENFGDNFYNFRLADLTPGQYFFRLKINDLDKKFTYSDMRPVWMNPPGLQAEITPNAVTEKCILKTTMRRPGEIRVEILGAGMQPMHLGWSFNAERESAFPLAVEALPSGMYYVSIFSENERLTLPFFKN